MRTISRKELDDMNQISNSNMRTISRSELQDYKPLKMQMPSQVDVQENSINSSKITQELKDEKEKAYQSYKKYSKEYGEAFKKSESKKGLLYNLFAGGRTQEKSREEFNKGEGKEIYEKYKQAKDNYDDINLALKQELVNQEKVIPIAKVLAPMATGAETAIYNLNTAVEKLATGTAEVRQPSSNELYYNKVRSETKSKIGNVLQDLAYTTGNMAPSMAMPGNKTALLMTGATSFGGAYNQAKQEGKSENQSTFYGLLRGASEAGLQKALGGLSGVYGKSLIGSKLSPVVDKALKKVVKNPAIRQYIGEMGSEFSEEYLQEILEPVFRNVALDENNKIKLFSEEALYSGMMGALNSALLNSPGLIQNKIEQNRQNNSYNQAVQDNDVNKAIVENNLMKSQIEQPTLNKNRQNSIDFSKTFAQQVDEVINGTYPKRDMLVVSPNTPKILQELGIRDLPITMTQKHLDTIVNKQGDRKNVHYHDLGVDLVKQIPEALSRPLNVLKSSTQDNSIVVITDLADNQERPIIASIKIDGYGMIDNIKIDTNVLTSAYGRSNYDNFMKKNIASGNILYDIDEGIIKKSSAADRVQFPMRGSGEDSTSTIPKNSSSISIDNISQNQQNVKLDTLSTNSNMQSNTNNSKFPIVDVFDQLQTKVDDQTQNMYNIKQEGVNYETSQDSINGRRNGIVTESGVGQEVAEKIRPARKYTKEEWRHFEQQANSTRKKELSSYEQNLSDKVRDNFNKEIIFFDKNQTNYNGGASVDNSNTIYVPYNLNDKGKNFVTYHEIMESNILHNKNLKQSFIDGAIEEIISDPNFRKTKESFIGLQANLKSVSDYLIAKEIICDTFAEKISGVPIDYNNYLSDSTKEVIDYNIQAFNNELSKNNLNAVKQEDALKINNTNQNNDTTNNTSGEVSIDDKVAQLLDRRPQRSKKSSIDKTNDVIQEIVNKGHYIDKLAKKANNPELKFKYDKILNSQAEGHYAIGVAQTDNNGKKIGKSLMEIWYPVERAGLVEDFSNYLLHKHNIDRYAQGKPVFGDSITSEISQKEVNKYEIKHPEFLEWAKDVNKYNRNNLKNMVDAGLTSAEAEEYYNNTYSNYVRIYRDITGNAPIQMTKNGIKVNSPIKKAKGGNQNILPLKDSMAQQTIEIKSAIRRNQFGLELLNTLKNGEKNVNYDGKNYVLKNSEGENSFVNKTNDGKYYFTVYENGTPIKMEIDEGIYKAFEKSKWKDPELFAPVRKLSKWQRSVLTIDNPLFIATNFFKDIGDAPLNSKYASKFYKNYIRALHQIATKGELYQQYMAMGGGQNTYFDYDKGVVNNQKGIIETIDDIKNKESSLKETPRAFLNSIRSLNEVIEQAPRLAEFISTIEDGKSVTEAMYNSAEITTNFKRGGDLTKMVNRNGANFLNASIQGFDKQMRNFTGQNGAKGYINILLKATIFGVLPSLLNDILLKGDEDYEELPEYVKDSYFLFKTENGKFIRLPKGRVTSIFGSVARRFKNQTQGKKDSWDGFGQQVLNQIAPNNPLEDNIFAPFISVGNNVSWNGSDIVPERLQNQLPKNQYDERTDAISKWLGEKLNLSPKKINYLLDQYSGGIGDIFLPLITPEARQNPISAKFTTDSVLNNKNISVFYDTVEELTKKANDPDASTNDILSSKYMTSKRSEISELYKEKREIQKKKITNSEKYRKVRDKQKEINKIAKEALENYDKIKMQKSDYAIVGEFKYKRTYDKDEKKYKWTKQRNK